MISNHYIVTNKILIRARKKLDMSSLSHLLNQLIQNNDSNKAEYREIIA